MANIHNKRLAEWGAGDDEGDEECRCVHLVPQCGDGVGFHGAEAP